MRIGTFLKTCIVPFRVSRLTLYPLSSSRRISSIGKKMGVEQSTANLALSECRIVVVGPRSGDDSLLELANLPKEARILATGSTLEELRQDGDLFTEGNVILVASGNAKTLAPIVKEMPFLTWIHSTFAGVDHIVCPEIVDNHDIVLTNAKGVFSSSLAEYVMQACMYFAKDIPRLIRQQQQKNWDKFMVNDLRGRTMGIIGYGDIGRACAKLAKPFGMKVIGLRRNPSLSEHDRLVDQIVGNDQLNYVIANSDYLVVCLALTPETKHFIKEENLLHAKKHLVLINIGRGALINEDDLIKCLENKTIAGAALDVFSTEPLPATSRFWELHNVLISPHNVDYTTDSRRSSVRHFVQNCERFLRREELDCIVDKTAGY